MAVQHIAAAMHACAVAHVAMGEWPLGIGVAAGGACITGVVRPSDGHTGLAASYEPFSAVLIELMEPVGAAPGCTAMHWSACRRRRHPGGPHRHRGPSHCFAAVTSLAATHLAKVVASAAPAALAHRCRSAQLTIRALRPQQLLESWPQRLAAAASAALHTMATDGAAQQAK